MELILVTNVVGEVALFDFKGNFLVNITDKISELEDVLVKKAFFKKDSIVLIEEKRVLIFNA